MDKRYTAAIELLGSFQQNEQVRVVLEDGKTHDMYVSRIMHRCDGSFGSPESSRVTVTYGPGRYATEVTADMLVLGTAAIESREPETEQNTCFCGERINYDTPGDEGGEFTATEEFVTAHSQYKPGDAVIGHAQCGMDYGLQPA